MSGKKLSELQKEMAEILLAEESPASCEAGIKVYRNNVMHSLIEALGEAVPVVKALVGDEFFAAMASIFIRQHPPNKASLIGFGEGFDRFLERFPPAKQLPYLPDMARFELAWLACYHAKDHDIMSASSQYSPRSRFLFHPSAQFLHLKFALSSVWLAHQQEEEPDEIELGEGDEYILLLRSNDEVEMRILTPQSYYFLHALSQNMPLEKAETHLQESEQKEIILQGLLANASLIPVAES